MPPTNISFATAVDIGALPVTSYVQTDINDGGVNFTVFLKFTAPLNCVQVWAWVKSPNVGSGYRPSVTPYDAAEVEILTANTHIPADIPNRPIQFPVTAGAVHYLQVVKNVDTAGPEQISAIVKVAPNTTAVPIESILVNGDETGQPLGIFSPTTNYQTIKFLLPFAFGEGGCILPDGRSMWDNRELLDKFVALYDANFTEIDRIDTGLLAFSLVRSNRTTGNFWLQSNETAGTSVFSRVDPDVLPLARTVVATATGFGGSCVGVSTNPAETIVYFSDNTLLTGNIIRMWDLVNNVTLGNFVTGPAGRLILDTLCLTNGNVIAVFADTTNNKAQAIVYSSAGAILASTTDFDSYEASYGIARVAYGLPETTAFWLKIRGITTPGALGTPTGDAIFHKIAVATGVVLGTITHTEFSGRNWIGPEGVTPAGESGIWNSCPLVVWNQGVVSPSGIYVIVANRRNDNYIAIPNPIFKTALMP